MHSDDVDLIAAYLRGDPEATRTIDDWIGKASARYRYSLGADGEDLSQEVHVDLFQLLQEGKFQGRARLMTFVWRITANRCLNQLRKKRNWQWTDLEQVDRDAGQILRVKLEMAGRVEHRDVIRKVLASMGSECHRLWLMVLDGLSYREMRERDGRKEGTLRVAVLRCREKAIAVRDALLESGDEGNDSGAQVTKPTRDDDSKGGSHEM